MSDDTATPVAGGEGEAGWEKELASGEGAIAGTDWMRLLVLGWHDTVLYAGAGLDYTPVL